MDTQSTCNCLQLEVVHCRNPSKSFPSVNFFSSGSIKVTELILAPLKKAGTDSEPPAQLVGVVFDVFMPNTEKFKEDHKKTSCGSLEVALSLTFTPMNEHEPKHVTLTKSQLQLGSSLGFMKYIELREDTEYSFTVKDMAFKEPRNSLLNVHFKYVLELVDLYGECRFSRFFSPDSFAKKNSE